MSPEDKIRQFIVDELQFPQTLTDDYPLLEREAIDSMGIFQIVGYLESEFGIEVGDEDLIPDHFATVAAMAELVRSKLAA